VRPPFRLRSSHLILFVLCMFLSATVAKAQRSDSTTHWALFAGRSIMGVEYGGQDNFGVGGFVGFRSRLLPIPLRATLAYDKFRGGPSTTFKVTSLHLDGIIRPIPAVLGIRPYLLGGFGVATQAPSGLQVVENGLPTFVPITRRTSLLVDVGGGLEFRRFFVEYRRSPFSVLGVTMDRPAISLGIRF
jgi:hypothetical protein